MCTVSVIPTPGGFCLTHSRDESPARSPNALSRSADGLVFPKDTLKNGTWIAAAPDGRTACLLNGAFEKHDRQPPYRRSRGLVLLDFFEEKNEAAFFENYDLVGIEPFTFLLFKTGDLTEFRWDGERRFFKKPDPNLPHFWRSATLYDREVFEKSETLFHDFLKKNGLDAVDLPENMTRLHLEGSFGDVENDFRMNRAGRVMTVSLTQVMVENRTAGMTYRDLV